jgi:hypothetical protein
VKYIALIHNNPEPWQALSQAERDEHNSDADAFLKMVTDHSRSRLAATAAFPTGPGSDVTPRRRDYDLPMRSARRQSCRRRKWSGM